MSDTFLRDWPQTANPEEKCQTQYFGLAAVLLEGRPHRLGDLGKPGARSELAECADGLDELLPLLVPLSGVRKSIEALVGTQPAARVSKGPLQIPSTRASTVMTQNETCV